MTLRIPKCFLLAALVSLAVSNVYARSKTDIIVLVNGDQLTGEIKKLERGLLLLSTDSMSKVSIEWDDVAQLTSQYYFEFEDWDGYKYYGVPAMSDSVFRVTSPAAVATFDKEQIVRISPIGESFWARVDGSVSFGVSYSKGSRIGKLDFAGDANYRVEKNYVEFRLTMNSTVQDKEPPIQRNEFVATYQRAFQRKLYFDLTGSAFRNDETGIALRLILSNGLGVHLVQTNHHMIDGLLGVSVNREWPTADTLAATNNVEGVVSVSYSVFKYDSPKTSLDSSIIAFPRLPDFDRIRLDLSINLRQELVKDFFWNLNFWDNFNSEPPSETDAKNDWGIVTSFGYSF